MKNRNWTIIIDFEEIVWFPGLFCWFVNKPELREWRMQWIFCRVCGSLIDGICSSYAVLLEDIWSAALSCLEQLNTLQTKVNELEEEVRRFRKNAREIEEYQKAVLEIASVWVWTLLLWVKKQQCWFSLQLHSIFVLQHAHSISQ